MRQWQIKQSCHTKIGKHQFTRTHLHLGYRKTSTYEVIHNRFLEFENVNALHTLASDAFYFFLGMPAHSCLSALQHITRVPSASEIRNHLYKVYVSDDINVFSKANVNVLHTSTQDICFLFGHASSLVSVCLPAYYDNPIYERGHNLRRSTAIPDLRTTKKFCVDNVRKQGYQSDTTPHITTVLLTGRSGTPSHTNILSIHVPNNDQDSKLTARPRGASLFTQLLLQTIPIL